MKNKKNFKPAWFDTISRLCSQLLTTSGLSLHPFVPSLSKNLFAFIICTLSLNLFAATINLKVSSTENATLQEAGVGQPFLLHVIVETQAIPPNIPCLKMLKNIRLNAAGSR